MEITVVLVIKILIAHYVSDFILQSNEMAQNKSSSMSALLKHIGAYTAGIFFIIFLLNGFLQIGLIAQWAIINGFLHFATDAITSRINSHFYKQGQTYLFFNGIGVDQLIHYSTLIITAALIL